MPFGVLCRVDSAEDLRNDRNLFR